MSAPIPGSADGSPRQGFYPDPSIPGYIRYWSGTAWVPGTSRPAPAEGEPMPGPPPGLPAAPLPALAAPVPPSPRPEVHRPPAGQGRDETGPVFFDEELPARREPAAWGDGPSVPAVRDPRAPDAAAPVAPAREGTMDLGGRKPAPGSAAPQIHHGPSALSSARPPGAWPDEARQPVPAQQHRPAPAVWAPPQVPSQQQLQPHPQPQAQLQPLPTAQPLPVPQAAPAQPAVRETVVPAPWKPPTENPFLQAARQEGRPAGLGRRLAARLVDTAVLGGALAALAVPLWNSSVEHIDEKVDRAKRSGQTVTVWLLDGTTGTYLAIVLAALLLGGVLYEVLPTAKWGRTLGKKLCGVRVLDIGSHDTASFGAALRRWLVYSLPGLLAVGLLGVLWCLFDRPWRQCWHDKAARTFVASGGA
ncbi:RDD family protein [Streptomyces sp. AV19]|uniref:RDD family protein n=1 Tax=Streptomyces sp. AV19 TaxID=2793068 RepID=UPI0018FE83B4|nr:RDD family protein [Streptomyces sp. AV19]MBH1938957.1 RDD family protein [Streptomyces sp. AV19]MDG4531505.1 RDD family protein [Streptomyces sp. AV19]